MRSLAALVLVFGAVCCLIGVAHVVLGPSAIVGSIPVNATMDGEDRFFGTLFLGFGAALIWCARNLPRRAGTFAALLAVFFAGGVARAISVLVVGWPHPLFVFLGGVELVLPPLLWTWFRAVRPAGAP